MQGCFQSRPLCAKHLLLQGPLHSSTCTLRPDSPHLRPVTCALYRWSSEDSDRKKRERLLDNAESSSYSRQSTAVSDKPASVAEQAPQASPPQYTSPAQQPSNGTSTGTARRSQHPADQPSSSAGADGTWDTGALEEDWGWGGSSSRPAAAQGSAEPANSGSSSSGASAGWGESAAHQQSPSEAGSNGAWGAVAEEQDGQGRIPPDITLLTVEERDRLLPVPPTEEQRKFFNGNFSTSLQRVGGAVLVTVLAAAKAPVLAAGALSFPVWWPWAQATLKNQNLRRQHRWVGLWRAEVLSMETVARRTPRFSSRTAAGRGIDFAVEPSFLVKVGDYSGACTLIALPYRSGYDTIQVGQAAELLVLSSSPTFERFKALKEAYLPQSGLWLSSYPYINRDRFLDLSLQVEIERNQEQQQAAPAMPPPW